MRLTLSQLRIVEAVARLGGVSRAAQEIGVTQPSVSTQLRAFEQRFRTRLLWRDGHDVSLTATGEALMPRIRVLLRLAAEIEQALEAERDLKAGRLRVGYSTHQFVMPVLSLLMERHPLVRIEARSMASYDLLALLRCGGLDAVFATLPASDQTFERIALRREEVVLMAPASDPLATSGSVDWATIGRLPLIRREPASGTRAVFDAAAAAAGVRTHVALDLGSWESMRAAVIAGIGYGVAMRGEVGEDPEVAPVRIGDGALCAEHCLITQPDARMLAPVEALIDAAQAVFDETKTDRRQPATP